MDSGFNTSGAPYEYTVAEKKNGKLVFKRITLIALYILWGAVFLFAGFALRIIVPFLALIPLSLWVLVFLTWRLTQVEYEYSFFGGALTALGLFMPVMEMLLNLTFRLEHGLVWAFYPMAALVLLGGMLIFLAICRPARETMERKFFL